MLNPVINADFPDPDIIRVNDTYYMVSTTMFLFPGGDLLKSKDLANWELAGHIFDTLGDDDRYHLINDKHAYARGMWAPCIRYNKGTFYVCFACNERKKSLLFTTKDPEGSWERIEMGGFYYDSSLFFDDDDRVYIVHGNTIVYLTELDTDTWGAKEGGINRILIKDKEGQFLGYEGSHLYKYNGKYYLFSCHMSKETNGRKTEDCFICDDLEGEFKGKNVLNDAMGYRSALQVAQGGMVDDVSGNMYMFMFQDRGALGRAPVIFPIGFDDEGYPYPDTVDKKVPVLFDGINKPPHHFVSENGADYPSKGFYDCTASLRGEIFDDCDFSLFGSVDELLDKAPWWQFSHAKDDNCYIKDGAIFIKNKDSAINLLHAKNTLTQRCMGPSSAVCVTVCGSDLNEGDYAGLCVYNAHYAGLAITKHNGSFYLVSINAEADNTSVAGDKGFFERIPVTETITELDAPIVCIRADADFTKEPDRCVFSYLVNDRWVSVPREYLLYFKLDLFIGCRFALFSYGTKTPGGCASFSDFKYMIPGT